MGLGGTMLSSALKVEWHRVLTAPPIGGLSCSVIAKEARKVKYGSNFMRPFKCSLTSKSRAKKEPDIKLPLKMSRREFLIQIPQSETS